MYLPLGEILDTEFEKRKQEDLKEGMEEMILLFETFYKWNVFDFTKQVLREIAQATSTFNVRELCDGVKPKS